MKATEFCYWLQGLFELSGDKALTEEQVTKIKNHLKLVFLYDIDPSYTTDPELQKIFQNIHDGKKPFEGVGIVKTPAGPIFGSKNDHDRRVKC
jgi:hypothetical protein